MQKRNCQHSPSLIVLLLLTTSTLFSQPYQKQLLSVFDTTPVAPTGSGTVQFDSTYSPSGSTWELDWGEEVVFDKLFIYQDAQSSGRSFELRLGKGGQVYSFRSSGFGEALPPQWRPSFDSTGAAITDPGPSIPIESSHGNWAVWNDEAWHMVGSDQRDTTAGAVVTQNIHQAGSYMNNYTHRASDLTEAPFYSPQIQSYYDSTDHSYSSVYWGQSENPPYVYDAPYEIDTPFPDPYRPSTLFYQRYTCIGDGVIQVDFLIYNFHRTRGIDYWNVPFLGIRNSSLPYLIMSNSPTDESSYEILNTKPGHPDGSGGFLPEFAEGAVVRVSGNNAASSAWAAFSTQPDGNGPTLAFVTAKETQNPNNGYGDFRYGTAMSNALRDVTILTRRAIGGAVDATTGLKMWGIVAGESLRGRYFIVVDDNITAAVQQITSRGLSASASVEKVTIDALESNRLHFRFSANGDGTYTPEQTADSLAEATLNSQPFTESYPVFLISTSSESRLSSNPYYYSLKPYDGTVKSIELLGFDSTETNTLVDDIVTPVFKGEKGLQKNTPVMTYTRNSLRISNVQEIPNELSLTNLRGQKVPVPMTYSAPQKSVSIDLNGLGTGVYILTFENSVHRIFRR